MVSRHPSVDHRHRQQNRCGYRERQQTGHDERHDLKDLPRAESSFGRFAKQANEDQHHGESRQQQREHSNEFPKNISLQQFQRFVSPVEPSDAAAQPIRTVSCLKRTIRSNPGQYQSASRAGRAGRWNQSILHHRIRQPHSAESSTIGCVHQDFIAGGGPDSGEFHSTRSMQNKLQSTQIPIFFQFHFRHRKMEFQQVLTTAEREMDKFPQLVKTSDVCCRGARGRGSSCNHGGVVNRL